MNKATGAGFEALISINMDFTYFNTFPWKLQPILATTRATHVMFTAPGFLIIGSKTVITQVFHTKFLFIFG